MRRISRAVALLGVAVLCISISGPASGAWEEGQTFEIVHADFDGHPGVGMDGFYQTPTRVAQSRNRTDEGWFWKTDVDDYLFERGSECPSEWPASMRLSGWVKAWWKFPDGTSASWPPTSTRVHWRLTGVTEKGAEFEAKGHAPHTPEGCNVWYAGPVFYGPWPSLGWPCSL